MRLLRSLEAQAMPLKEVIVIDSSDTPLRQDDLRLKFPRLNILYRRSIVSACTQRNLGIALATSEFIFLTPDDLEIPSRYIASLAEFVRTHPAEGAVTGICLEPDESSILQTTVRIIPFRQLLWQFIFQLSVWADVSKTPATWWQMPMLALLKKYYKHRGNTYTAAGWPLVTQVSDSVFRASLFTLGGALIRRRWLLQSPYDERLDPYGIGDNYGVTMGFPKQQPVVVIADLFVIHYKERTNRLPDPTTYFRRILALDYFLGRKGKRHLGKRLILAWSLIGNLTYQFVRRQEAMRKATLRALWIILWGTNPYLAGLPSDKCINPNLR